MGDNELIAYKIVIEKQKKIIRKKKKKDERNLGDLTELAHQLHRKKNKK